MSTHRLFIYDYKFDQFLFLHALELTKRDDGDYTRSGHKVIRVTQLPFRHHIGPFSTKEEAEKSQKELDNGILRLVKDDQVVNEQAESCVSEKLVYRFKVFHATPDINTGELKRKRRSHPFCFVQNSIAAIDWWLQIEFVYSGSDAFDYSDLFKKICELEEREVSTYKHNVVVGGVRPKVHKTDRNYDELVIRLLSRYGIPGPFDCNLDSDFSINHMTSLTWKEFKGHIGKTQPLEEQLSLLPNLELLKRADLPPVLVTKHRLLFRVGIFLKCGDMEGNVLIYEVCLDANDGYAKKVATLTSSAYQKLIVNPTNYRNQIDLVLVPQTHHDITLVRAKFVQQRQKKNLRIARKNIITNLLKIWEPRERPRSFQFLYQLAPVIIMETNVLGENKDQKSDEGKLRKWLGDFDLVAYMFQLLSKSRLSGLTWSFHEAPGELAIVSRRMESILTRLFTRNGFKIMVDNSIQANTSASSSSSSTPEDQEDISDSIESDPDPSSTTCQGVLDQQSMMRFTFVGGINPPVKPQIVTAPYTVANTDFSLFYGAGGISTFKLDFCNIELCSKINWKARELIEQANSAPGRGALGSIDATPITQEWFDHIMDKVNRGTTITSKEPILNRGGGGGGGGEEDSTPKVTNPLIFVEFIEQCMALRYDLSEVIHREMKPVAQFLVNYLKMIVSASYGAIRFTKHRYHWPLLGPLVTNGCRKIITHTSGIIASKYPEAEQIMMVTDSIAPRFPPKKLTKQAKDFLEGLGSTMKRLYACNFLNIKVEYFDALIMTKTNHYATLRKIDGKPELKLHGYSPKHADTPAYSAAAIKQFLADFLSCFTDTITVEQTVATSTTDEARELFRQCLKICFDRLIDNDLISPAIPKHLQLSTNENPDSEARRPFSTILTVSNAERSHFSYSREELENESLLASSYKTLGLIQGVVVDYDPNSGFIVSTNPKRPVSKEAWERFYLHRQFRLVILDIFQTIFPLSDVDDAIREILPCLQPIALDATSRRTLEHRGVVPGGSRNSKFSVKMIWDRIYFRSKAKAPEIKSMPNSALDLPPTTDANDPIPLDESDAEQSFWTSAEFQVRELEKRQFVDHRFSWNFEIECLGCGQYNNLPVWNNQVLDEEEIRHTIALVSTCASCKKSIYGDLMLLSDKETTRTTNHVTLCCREEYSDEPVDFLEASFDQGGVSRYRRTFAYRLKNYNSLTRLLSQIMGNSLLEQQKMELTGYTERKPLSYRKRPYNYHGLLDDANGIRENPISTLLGVVVKAMEAHPFYNQIE